MTIRLHILFIQIEMKEKIWIMFLFKHIYKVKILTEFRWQYVAL